MGLEAEKPKHYFQKGNPGGVPGRKRGPGVAITVEKRMLKKHKTHPLDKLVQLATWLEVGEKYTEAADIWLKLLPYFDSVKKPVKMVIPIEEDEPIAPEHSDKLLKELENGTSGTQSSEGPRLGARAVNVPIQTGTESDVREHKEE